MKSRLSNLLAAGALSALALAAAAGPASAQAPAATGASGLKVVGHIAGPDGGWDYASFDAARRRLYVAHGASVLAIDVDSGAVNAAFAPGARLHAVVPVPGSDRVVTTNSGDSSAKVIGARDGALIASIPTPSDPDGAIYDPVSGKVIVIGGDSGTVTLVDPVSAKAVGTITIGGALEFAAADHHGRLFVNVEDRGEIAVVDLDGRRLINVYPMAGCRSPTGLALVEGNRLISACANGMAKIIDADTGQTIATLAIGARPDAVLYDPDRAVAYIPSGLTGTLAVIALKGDRANTVIDNVPTQVGARTGAVDPKTGRIYLPAAEYLPPAAPGGRPTVKSGTFQVLVVGRE